MKGLPFINGPAVYMEIGQGSLKMLHGEESLQVRLERQPNGHLTAVCREATTARLREFLKRKNWQPKFRAICGINARGVSLRRLSIPAGGKDELQRVLRLQIESEFPLPPAELAWGYQIATRSSGAARPAPPAGRQPAAGAPRQDLVVVALKKEMLEEYAEVLLGSGVSPTFTLAALARSGVCPQPGGAYAVLEIGSRSSELLSVENGVPSSIRILAWGGENITGAIEAKLSLSREEAEQLKIEQDQKPASDGAMGQLIQSAIGSALDSLAASINAHWKGERLFLTGRSARYKHLADQLRPRLAGRVVCERIEAGTAEGRSAAILGLKKSNEQESGGEQLIIALKESKSGESATASGSWKEILRALRASTAESREHPGVRKYAGLAAVLVAALLCFPYAEGLLLKRSLSKKLAALKTQKTRLPMLDRELAFLQYLKQSQPPYLEALSALAKYGPAGTRLESLTMNRRGELSLRGSFPNIQQLAEFRAKLIQSGFFSLVAVEEQTPSQDRQKLTVRMTAQWKPAGERQNAAIDLTSQELEKLKNSGGGEMMMMGGMPAGMPPGMEFPGGMPPGAMPSGAMPPSFRGPMGMPQMSGGPAGLTRPTSSRKAIRPEVKGSGSGDTTNSGAVAPPAEIIIQQ